MSLLTNATNANTTNAYFLKANALVVNASTLNAGNISTAAIQTSSLLGQYISTIECDAEFINNSTINTLHVDLDGQILTATSSQLLLNGIPIATQSSLSSIADWSLDPAISTVQMDGFDLNAAGTVSSLNVRAGNGFFTNLIAFNSLFVSTATSTISTSIEWADLGNFSSINVDQISSGAISSGSIASQVASISSLSTDQILVSSINTNQVAAPIGSFSTLNAGNISSGVLAATSIRMTAERFSTVADNGADILNKAKVSVDAVNGLNGEVNLSARPGFAGIGGTVNILAEGGVTPAGVGYGGEVNITATTGGFTTLALTSAVNLNAAGINSYAGAITPVGSVAGYNFIHGDSGVNLTAGTPSFIPNDPLTLYLYGLNGTLMYGTQYIQGPIRPYSDLTTNPADLYIEDYSNLITRGYVQLRGISTATFKGGDTAILGVNRIQFSTAGGALENVSTLNGLPVAAYENVSSFADLSVSSLTVSSVNGLNISSLENISSFTEASVSSLTVSSVNGLNINSLENISSFNDLQASTIFASTISTAVLYGANPNLFGLGIQGLEIQTAPTGQVWISSPQTNIAGLINCSTVGAANVFARNGGISSLGVSSLAASTLTLAGLSSILFSTSGAAGGQGQPAGRLLIQGNDLDLGQQDLWVQQVRVGAANPGGSAQTEVIWYSPDASTIRGIGLGGADLTLRIQSTINSGTNNGYILDTSINRPFFSTINQSTAMMASYPSTTLGNFGISTLSFIPPKVVAGTFISLSTQAITANTPLALWAEVTDFTTGGIATSTNAIVIPSPGIYELTASIQFTKAGGAGTADWWFRLNGTDLANSASEIYLPAGGSGQALGNITLAQRFNAGDKVQVIVASTDTGVAATFLQSTITTPYTRPAVPSVILGAKCLNY